LVDEKTKATAAGAEAEEEGILLPDVDDGDYQAAGSKFVVLPPGEKEIYLNIECGMLDWDNAGVSMMIPIVVTEEGVNEGKQDKLSFGVTKNEATGRSGLWKGKQAYEAITGHAMPMKKGADGKMHPAPIPKEIFGKAAVGHWVVRKGHKGGDPDAEEVSYPKIQEILPAGSKPSTESLL
jgi:hypothetical protein